MDPITLGIITSLATNYFTEFTTPVITKFFSKAIAEKPELENMILKAKTSKDFEEVFNESSGIIDATANTGDLEVLGAFLEAVKGIRFDHANGTVIIQGTVMEAPILVTGGSKNSTGHTRIEEDTELISEGSSIKVGKGSGIYIGGDSQIRQN